MPVLLPRTVLGVIVAEYIISKQGLGGALALGRAMRDFKGTFVIVMLLIIAALLIQSVASLYGRQLVREIEGYAG